MFREIFVPSTGESSDKVLFADMAEAVRAMGTAMPLIARADRVLVTTGGEAGAGRDATPASAGGLAERLQRHAPLLLAAAIKARAGLLVLGGYGDGAMRQNLFGGFTRTELGGANSPVLMMH